MATRTAISRRREVYRASSRFATLAQATASSSPTAPIKTSIEVFTWLTSESRRDSTFTVQLVSKSG